MCPEHQEDRNSESGDAADRPAGEGGASGPNTGGDHSACAPKAGKNTGLMRRFMRPLWVILAILLAILAGVFLMIYDGFGKNGRAQKRRPAPPSEKKDNGEESVKKSDIPSVDKEEHRKGMPVRDFIVE